LKGTQVPLLQGGRIDEVLLFLRRVVMEDDTKIEAAANFTITKEDHTMYWHRLPLIFLFNTFHSRAQAVLQGKEGKIVNVKLAKDTHSCHY